MSSRTTHAGAESLMKGKLWQSSKGEGGWHVMDSLSDNGNNDEETNGDVANVSTTRSMITFSEGEADCTNNGKEIIDFLKDNPKEMTYSRRIALSLRDKKWYNPRAGEETDLNNLNDSEQLQGSTKNGSGRSSRLGKMEKAHDFDSAMHNRTPRLEKGWAYFEHVALYRYLVPQDEQIKVNKNIIVRIFRKLLMKANKSYEKAEPGENDDPTRLYPPIFLPHKQLGDFGLGIGLYFSTLRAITCIMLVAGVISIYNLIYFGSDDYLPSEYREDIPTLLTGSAICTATSWVPCDSCVCQKGLEREFGTFPPDRCAQSGNLTFVLRNDCDGTPWQVGAVNFASIIWVLLATFSLSIYLKRQEIAFDEDEQTAQDYSIVISNPPGDAKDTDEWADFFRGLALNDCPVPIAATVITIAVDNDLLVRSLVERRELLRTISNQQDPSSSMKMLDLARTAAEQERNRGFWGKLLAIFVPGIPEHFARVVALDAKVEGLAQLEYPVTNVFVTFETEAAQRHVLSSLSVGSAKAAANDVKGIDPNHLFRGKYVLDVREADEPNTVRWQDLNAGAWQRMKEKFFTTFCTLIAIVVVAVLVNLANQASTVGAAFTIAIFNTVFPMFAKWLCNLESHSSEGSKQTSLYFKIAAFRWVSTAVVISIITPFTSTLAAEKGLIPQVYALFFADIVTTNALQILDIVGHLKRHILAPRAATQDAMNLCFQGTEYELAERYTDMTKILFLCLWYCSIFPGSYILCAFSLGIKYFVDRFCLMRSWKRAPALGTTISRFSRRYFFTIAIAVMAIISSYYWSGFPYDNICANDSINTTYQGNFLVFPVDESYEGIGENVSFTAQDVDYRFCNQDFMAIGGGVTFPFVPTMSNKITNPSEWMTEEQILTTTYFGWAAVGIAGLVLLKFVYGWWVMFLDRHRSTYSEVGLDQGINYSEVTSRSAYIPQVYSRLFAYPLIACNTDFIDEELYDWTDPDRTYSFYDLSKDAAKLLTDLNLDEIPGFSIVKHYPPQSLPSEMN